MSIKFNDTTNKNGLIQLIERNCGFNDGDISGNSTLLAQFTADINLALDKAISIILPAGGTWQFDDSNQSDYPIITTNIVSGQRDYPLTTDGSGNLILDIYKVLVANSSGVFSEISPVDQQTTTNNNSDTITFLDGNNSTGTPTRYDKTGNGIFLDPIPNYNSTGGLKVLINREGSYFTVSDTTKKPGFAGLFHEYLALRPSYQYAYRKGLANANALRNEMLVMERAIDDYYGSRERDVKMGMTANVEDCR